MLSSNSKYRVAKLGYNHTNEMGGFHRAGADKKIHIFGQKWPISNFIFVFST